MDILDFLPKYPYIEEKDFYKQIYSKKEFNENSLQKVEAFPKEKGAQTKYQRTIARYLSSYTPYKNLLLVHAPGLGKTCSAIGAIEKIIKEERNVYSGAIVMAKGRSLLENFKNELVWKCTDGKYIPDDYKVLTSGQRIARIKQKTSFYKFKTYVTFANSIKNLSNSDISENYSNKIIVVDEVHNIKPQDEEEKEVYSQFHRFLHSIKNSKVIFLSGTPMKDSPDEIATLMNLLLPLDKQLPTGQNFISEFMETDDNNILKVKKSAYSFLKNTFKGYISFLREPESSIPKKFIGEKNFGGLNHLVVNPLDMSDFQSKYYNEAYTKDTTEQKGIYTNSKEASLFVYPDGRYGKAGFDKYIIAKNEKKAVKDYRMSNELTKELQGRDEKETLTKIRKYSVSYAAIIEKILKTKGNCFIYSSIAQGSGAILFSLLLRLFNFSQSFGNENTKGLRYALLTKKSASDKTIKNVRNSFNRPENKRGEYIKVIIGTKAISEGYSFNNVIFESINTPHWNYSETAQAIARGIRLGSHNDLINDGENPVVEIMQPVSIPESGESLDLKLYVTSEDKDISISSVLRLLMVSAIDCGLNYKQNYVDGKDYSRECNYMECKYTCDGIDLKEDVDIDYLTYNLYYANEPTSNIKRSIENKLREEKVISIQNLKSFLLENNTEERVDNILKPLEDEKMLDIQTFRRVYSLSPVQDIIYTLEEIFTNKNEMSFNDLISQINEKTDFELLLALRTIINNNIVIRNRFGFPCYLREDNNIFYLISNLSGKPDFFLSYYTSNPYTRKNTPFADILKNLFTDSLKNKLDILTDLADDKEAFAEQVKLLSPEYQEYLAQSAIVAKLNKVPTNTKLRKAILDYYRPAILYINDTWVLKIRNPICLLGKNFSDWKECPEEILEVFEKQKEEKVQSMKMNNPYGLYGKYNPQNKKFKIVDFQKEEKARLEKTKERQKAKVDKRITYSLTCTPGWKLEDLVEIMVNRLRVDPPKDFLLNYDSEELIEIIRKNKRAFLNELVENQDENGLRRIIYWGTKDSKYKGIGTAKTICEKLREWLRDHNLLDIDTTI